MAPLQVHKSADPLASLRIDRSDQRRDRGRGTKWFVLIFLALLIGGGVYAWQEFGSSWLRIEVRAATAEVRVPGVADSILSAQGYLKSRQQASIGAKLGLGGGRIVQLFVEEGQKVTRGQVLVELEHDELDASMAAMRAAIDVAQAELDETENMLVQDERDFYRAEQLYRNRSLSLADYERYETTLKATRSRQAKLAAQVALAKARLRETEQQRENMFVRAPFDGTVISKEVEVGETLTALGTGAVSGRGSVITLADLSRLEVDTDVKEGYVSRLSPGQEATVAVDAVPDRRYRGRVRTIIPMGDRARGTIKVKVEILDADERLFPEMAATVHFQSEGKEGQGGKIEPEVFVPELAVVRDESGPFVWQIVDERVRRLPIEIGETREGRVPVRTGLRGGEQVVVAPPDSLTENEAVRIAGE